MLQFFSTLILIFISVTCSFAQQTEILSLEKTDLQGAKIHPARTFNGESLYGYIDGGAELYIEYGFSEVWVAEIEYLRGNYKTEIYKMKGAEEAFGIFSVSRFKCNINPPISVYTCQTRYQLQVCCGPYYISIINRTGTEKDSTASVKIAESVVKKIKEESADLSGYLPGISQEIIRKRAVLVKGKLGLMNGASEWEDYFAGMTGYTLVILPEDSRTLLSVKFQTPDDFRKFAAIRGWNINSIKPDIIKMSDSESVMRLSETHIVIEAKH